MMGFVSWDHEIPNIYICIYIHVYIYIYIWKNKIHIPNHQPEWDFMGLNCNEPPVPPNMMSIGLDSPHEYYNYQ